MSQVFYAAGLVLIVISGWLIWNGVEMEVTVQIPEAGRVANAQLMHYQLVQMLLGGLGIVAGAVFLVGGAVVEAILMQTNRLTKLPQ